MGWHHSLRSPCPPKLWGKGIRSSGQIKEIKRCKSNPSLIFWGPVLTKQKARIHRISSSSSSSDAGSKHSINLLRSQQIWEGKSKSISSRTTWMKSCELSLPSWKWHPHNLLLSSHCHMSLLMQRRNLNARWHLQWCLSFGWNCAHDHWP